VGDAPERETRPDDALGVDDQVEAPARKRPAAEELDRALADPGVLDDFVEKARHDRGHEAGMEALLFAGDPGDPGAGKGLAQAAPERQLEELERDDFGLNRFGIPKRRGF